VSNERDDGGSAFPEASDEWCQDSERYRPTSVGGMSLRDYFAAKAMAALIARVPYDERHGIHAEAMSFAAYNFADAMLKAREQ
jgi:hypothetical protein